MAGDTFTISGLASNLNNAITAITNRDASFDAWLIGSPTGGPYANGVYSLVSAATGASVNTPSPATLAAMVTGPAGQAAVIASTVAQQAAQVAMNANTVAVANAALQAALPTLANITTTAASINAANVAVSAANVLIATNLGLTASYTATAQAAANAAASNAAVLTLKNTQVGVGGFNANAAYHPNMVFGADPTGTSGNMWSWDSAQGDGLFNLTAGAYQAQFKAATGTGYFYGGGRGASRISLSDNALNVYLSTLGNGGGQVTGNAVTWITPLAISTTSVTASLPVVISNSITTTGTAVFGLGSGVGGSMLWATGANNCGHEWGQNTNEAHYDFHTSGRTDTDYDVRLLAVGPANGGVGSGSLAFQGSGFSFSVRPTFAGATPWDSTNLPNPLSTTGGVVSGATAYYMPSTYGVGDGTNGYRSNLIVNQTSATAGDAFLDFLVTNRFGARFGLRSDGEFARGGWSDGATSYKFWTEKNLNPAAYMPLAGGRLTGAITFSGSSAQFGAGVAAGYYADGTNLAIRTLNTSGSTIYFQNYGGAASYATFATGACNFISPLQQNGQQVYHTGNLNPGAYAALSGATFSGTVDATSSSSAGMGVRVRAYSGGSAYLQFTDVGATTQWSRLTATNGSLTCETDFHVSGSLYFAASNPVIQSGGSYVTIPNGLYCSSTSVPTYIQGQLNVRTALGNDQGTLSINSVAQFSSNVRALATNGTGQFTAVSGNTMGALYNDGSNVYLLCNSANNTSFGSLRPFSFGISAGNVALDGTGAGVSSGGTISAPNFYVTSDARLKTNVVALQGSAELLDALRPCEFDKTYGDGSKSLHQAGFIAQEVEALAPMFVAEGADGYLTVDMVGLIPHLVAEVQNLRGRLAQVEAR